MKLTSLFTSSAILLGVFTSPALSAEHGPLVTKQCIRDAVTDYMESDVKLIEDEDSIGVLLDDGPKNDYFSLNVFFHQTATQYVVETTSITHEFATDLAPDMGGGQIYKAGFSSIKSYVMEVLDIMKKNGDYKEVVINDGQNAVSYPVDIPQNKNPVEPLEKVHENLIRCLKLG